MSRVFNLADATPERQALLRRMKVAVVGYGNQGRAQALNLRNAGAQVTIGNRADDYAERARADGFAVRAIAEAVADADATLFLIPDEDQPAVHAEAIAPRLRNGSALAFASGYNLGFGLLEPSPGVDVLLLAPRMIGAGVRELAQRGEGFHSFVGVERDATGKALDTLLALAWGIGTLHKGAVELTCRQEAELDLFNEQAFGPAFGHVLLAALKTLTAAGYPPEAAYLELYMSGEFGYICQDMAKTGLVKQLDRHSPASQYGAITRGMRFLTLRAAEPMKRILGEIRSGAFTREWERERRLGSWKHKLLRFFATRQPVARQERAARATLGIPDPE